MKKRSRKKSYNARLFKRHVLLFASVTLLVLLLVIYFALATTIITITPAIATESYTTTFRVVGKDTPPATPEETPVPDFTGTFLSKEFEHTTTLNDLGEGNEEPTRAGGTVTFYNNWNRTQPLQAGTRLLSDKNILFRTVERVDIPAGGSVVSSVLADEPGKQGEIEPSRFEIVALWDGLKPLIYAESITPFTGGTRRVTRVNDSHLEKLREVFRKEVNQKAQEVIAAEAATNADATLSDPLVATNTKILSEKISALVGDEVSSLSLEGSAKVTAILLDRAMFFQQLTDSVTFSLPEYTRLVGIPSDTLTLTVNNVPPESDTALLDVQVHRQVAVTSSDPIFDPKNFVGKSRPEILDHFSQFESVATADVHFSPFWVIRSPRLPDHIKIRFQEPQ